MFSSWLKKEAGIEESVGLEAAKQKIIGEARRKASPIKVTKDSSVIDPKVIDQVKDLAADAEKRSAMAKDRAAGSVDDAFQDGTIEDRRTKAVTGKSPADPSKLDLSGVGGGSMPPIKPPVASVPQPAPEPEDEETPSVGKRVVDRIQKMIDSQQNAGRGGRTPAPVNKLAERFNSEVRRGMLSDLVDDYSQLHSDENLESWNQKTDFSDPEQVINFLRETIGMQDINGKLGMPNFTPAQKMVRGMNPFPAGMNGREYRGVQFLEMIKMMGGLPHAEGIRGGTSGNSIGYNNKRKFHQEFLKNNFDGRQAEIVYDMLHADYQGQLNGLGAPGSTMRTIRPDVDQLVNIDTNGDTSLDQMEFGDEDEQNSYKEMFKSSNRPNRERGIMMLQKAINSGFRDELTGLPFFGGLDSLTADHMEGKEVGEAVRTGEVESPLNLALISRNLNQVKSGGIGDDKDTFNGLLNSDSVSGTPFDRFFDEDEEGGDQFDSNRFAAWAANRLMGSHFDERLTRMLEGPSDVDGDGDIDDDDFIQNIEDLANLNVNEDNRTYNPDIRKYIDRSVLDLANLSKAVPQKTPDNPDEAGSKIVKENSWRGGSGVGYDNTGFLDGMRKAMIANMISNPEVQQHLSDETISSSVNRTRNDTDESYQKKIIKERKARRKKLAKKLIKGPMQGLSARFGLGRLTNDEYVEEMRKMGEGFLSHIGGEDSEHFSLRESIMGEMNRGLDEWKNRLGGYVGGDSPLNFPENDPRVVDTMYSEYGRQIMRSAAARQSMSPEEIEAFYQQYQDHIASGEKPNERFIDDDGNRLSPFSESWLTSDTDLL